MILSDCDRDTLRYHAAELARAYPIQQTVIERLYTRVGTTYVVMQYIMHTTRAAVKLASERHVSLDEAFETILQRQERDTDDDTG